MLLINCKGEFPLTWIDNCVLTIAAIGAKANATGAYSATFKIKDAKLYVPVGIDRWQCKTKKAIKWRI